MTAAASYLDPATLAAISSLEVRARLIVEGLMTGMHRSPYHGFSVEFAEHRQYAPGDDIRHLDWKVFGRTDKLYLKQYQQETNLDLLLLVDASGSMAYSSQTNPAWRKYDHAASLAASLAYLALQQQDRVGLILFDDHMHHATRLSNTHEHWRSVVEALAGASLVADEAGGKSTSIGRLFDELLAKRHQRSLIVLVSDLFDDPAALERALARIQHRRHDLILVQTLDPAERTFPFRSPADFVGLEGEGVLGLDPPAVRRAYLNAFHEHQRQVDQIARRFQFDHLVLDTGESLGPALSHFLARRMGSTRS
ncbi:MAG: DUF58 domain-containing protein [Phycisphaeraceae bacterium]|nr:DUF58 domain-containing protein [Phycisphaeraceae bacterium]